MRPLIPQHKLWGSSRLLSLCSCEALCVRVVCQVRRLELSTMADGESAVAMRSVALLRPESLAGQSKAFVVK